MSEKNEKINKEPDWDRVRKSYKEWIKKISLIPTAFYNIVAILAFIVAGSIYGSLFKNWVFLGILLIFFLCSFKIANREGHRDGYMYGYGDGYERGRDDAFGINEEMRHFIDIESKVGDVPEDKNK